MSRCIVCGLNDSSGSRHAASMASRLARDLNSRALLVHVREGERRLQRFSPSGPGRTRRIRRTLRLTAGEHCFPPGTEIRVRTGHAASTLIAIGEQEDAELLVVGAGGHSTASPSLLGSVSSTLMREAPCPVVVVPPATIAPLDAGGMRAVVCGIADDEMDAPTLRLAADLTARLGGQLQAVHAHEGTDVDDAEQRVARLLERAGVNAGAIISPPPPADALQRVADERNASLIVIGSGTGLVPPSIALGSVPTHLAAQGRTAVVVLPPGALLDRGSGHYELAADAA
jgi:nucleotide-binding universal stress UspA family protein